VEESVGEGDGAVLGAGVEEVEREGRGGFSTGREGYVLKVARGVGYLGAR